MDGGWLQGMAVMKWLCVCVHVCVCVCVCARASILEVYMMICSLKETPYSSRYHIQANTPFPQTYNNSETKMGQNLTVLCRKAGTQ